MAESHHPAPDVRQNSLKGVAYIMAAFMIFALLDTTSKYLSRYYPVPSLMWARYSVHMALMLVFFGPHMRLNLVYTARPGMQVLRGLLLLVTSFMFMNAIKFMPLAQATAIGFI